LQAQGNHCSRKTTPGVAGWHLLCTVCLLEPAGLSFLLLLLLLLVQVLEVYVFHCC
jgi:hypothetical protein